MVVPSPSWLKSSLVSILIGICVTYVRPKKMNNIITFHENELESEETRSYRNFVSRYELQNGIDGSFIAVVVETSPS